MADTNDRAAKIARIQRIERIHALEAEHGISDDASPGEPSKQEWHFGNATAADAGKADPVGLGLGALGAGAKTLDVARGGLTAPMLALALQGITGKKVYNASEQLDALNPTNLSTFPSSSELYKRAGVPEGAKMSDFVGGYADPDKEDPAWYEPEKGGMLDFTLRGAGGLGTDIAIDPLNWLSFGAAGTAKAAAKEGAVAMAKSAAEQAAGKGLIKRGLEMGGNAVAKVSEASGAQAVAKRLAETKAGQAAIGAAQAPSRMTKGVGKKLYNMMLSPVEEAGQKFGKNEVGETLYNAGITSPTGLKDSADGTVKVLMDARDKILQEADDAAKSMPEGSGYASMRDAMAPTLKRIADYKASNVPELEELAQQLEEKVGQYLKRDPQMAHSEVSFAKATPDQIVELPKQGVASTPIEITKSKDRIWEKPAESYFPKALKHKVTPGEEVFEPIKGELAYVPGEAPKTIAGKEVPMKPGVTARQVSRQKTTAGLTIPDALRNDAAKSSPYFEATSEIQSGLRNETERTVARNLSEKKAVDLAELNAEAGKLLTTKKAMQHVENLSNRATNVTGTDTIMAAHNLQAAAIRKTLETLRAKGAMPTGYALRKLSEGGLTGPAIDALVRKTMVDNAGRGSREERVLRGQEE